jgi:hypothetical protein
VNGPFFSPQRTFPSHSLAFPKINMTCIRSPHLSNSLTLVPFSDCLWEDLNQDWDWGCQNHVQNEEESEESEVVVVQLMPVLVVI